MSKRTCVVGIDNGVTGSITVLYADKTFTWWKTPVVKCRNYTKTVRHLERINFPKLLRFLSNLSSMNEVVLAVMERPMVNPKRWVASTSALRCLEATIIALEMTGIPYAFIDSKQWQKEFLPEGTKGSDDLKRASDELAIKKYPIHVFKNGEGDSCHIAEYALKHFVNEEKTKENENGTRETDVKEDNSADTGEGGE